MQTIVVTSRECDRGFSPVASRVGFGGVRALVTRNGKPLCAVVPVADLEQLVAGGPTAADVLAVLRDALASPVQTSVLAAPTPQEGAER